ncbi:MAG TPA: hypothetical protein VMT71_14380 [Syntrophorhabdales bacterium]|nr:hypothetical protein [Syntrophorhabdales bacterium]
MKRAFLIALTLVISVAFVTVVFAQAPAPEKKAAPEKTMKAPASGQKEESGPQSPAEKKADMKKAPKAPKGGQKEESTAAGESKKADKGPAPKAEKGGQKEESPPAPAKK